MLQKENFMKQQKKSPEEDKTASKDVQECER